MSIYQLQTHTNPNVREREINVRESNQVQLVQIPESRVKRIFVAEAGIVSYVEDYDGSPNNYITVLQDIPDKQHDDHGEKLILKNEMFTNEGTDYSISSCEGYTGLKGPHLFVEAFIYDHSEKYGGEPRILGIEREDAVPYESTKLPLKDGVGYVSGLSKIEILPQAKEKTPYIIEFREKVTIRYFSLEGQWEQKEADENTLANLLSNTKVIATTDPALLYKLTQLIDTSTPLTRIQDSQWETKKKNREDPPNKTQVTELMRKMCNVDLGRAGLGDYAKQYYNGLAQRIVNIKNGAGQNPPNNYQQEITITREKLKRSYLSQTTILGILNEIEGWKDYDEEKAKIFLTHTLPTFLLSSEIDQNSSHRDSINMALNLLAKQTGEGEIKIITPVCPPYDYCRERNGNIRHMSGRLLPTIGDRFENTATTIADTFQPLIEQGISVSLEICTYTGETKKSRDLIDLGVDVQEYYLGEEEKIFQALQASKTDAEAQSDRHLRNRGIDVRITSIEKLMGSLVEYFVTSYTENFPNCLEHLGTDENQINIRKWLNENFGVGEGWLMFYEEQEKNYRRKQEQAIGGRKIHEPLVISALEESLLHMLFIKYAKSGHKVVWDLETTDNYMLGTLRHHPSPVLMGAVYDPNNPESKFNIRQPFNTPITL